MSESEKKYVIAVDSGGTFADCVVMDNQGTVTTAKSLSTPENYANGVINAVSCVAESLETTTEDLLANIWHNFCHGGTVAINALLTRNGVKVGLLTTKGFEDTLLMGRVDQKIAGLSEEERIRVHKLNKAETLVPRYLTKGITERIDSTGHEVVRLNRDEARRQIKALVDEGVEAIAICFLWSFLDPSHERAVKQIIADEYPDIFVSTSSELSPVIGEYERMATVVVNSYLTPITSRYLTSLQQKLQAMGLQKSLLIMQNVAGTVDVAEALDNAVNLLASGPVGGVLASKNMGELVGHTNIIATDVGGTSFDVGLIVDGEFEYTYSPVFSQYRLHSPIIDIKSIGAGGGSIAWLEEKTGIIKVGPQSAGSLPGPICYDRGGIEPTVSDANLILGRIDPDNFLGGRMSLNKDKATQILKEKLADPLGMSVEQAAYGIIQVTTAHMADLVRKVTIDKGYDPGDFTLYSYGGAGPLCCFLFSPQIGGVKEVVIPANSSVYSAYGMACSDIVKVERYAMPMTAPFDFQRLADIFDVLDTRIISGLERNGVADQDMRLTRSVGARFWGQVHELTIPLKSDPLNKADMASMKNLENDFKQRYENRYGNAANYKDARVELVAFEVKGVGLLEKPKPASYPPASESVETAFKGKRQIYLDQELAFQSVSIYSREKLQPGHRVKGPAVIEAVDTTIFVDQHQELKVDEYLNLLMRFD